MRTSRFLSRGHSFSEIRNLQGQIVFDTGMLITQAETGFVSLIDPTSVRGPGPIGTVYGDAVYHNFYTTRLKTTKLPELQQISREASSAWGEAVNQYLS